MPEPQPPPPPPKTFPSPWAGGALPRGSATLHWRLRRLLYGAFGMLALWVLAQAWWAQKAADDRAQALRMLDMALDQQVHLEQLAVHGAALLRAQAPYNQDLGALTLLAGQLRADAGALAQLMQEGSDPPLRQTWRGLQAPWDAWQRDYRELLKAVLAMQALTDAPVPQAGEAVVPVPALLPEARAYRMALLDRLGAAAEEARTSAQALSDRLADVARAGEARQRTAALVWVGGALALLLALAGFAVEPGARAVQRHLRRLGDQAHHLHMLALVAERTQAIVMITDTSDRLLWANDAFTRLTGWPRDEALGRKPGELLHPPDAATGPTGAQFAAIGQAVAQGNGVRAECLNRTRDGRDLWLDCDLQALRDDSGALLGFVSVNHDITDRRVLQEQLHRNARTDALTRLPNRAVVMDRLKRAVAHARRHPRYGFAVLFMDFDRFKQVNDTLGHGAGDELLRQIAGRLEATLRPGDAVARVDSMLQMAARLGGDEFVVVLEGVADVETVCQIAQRLLAALEEPYRLLGQHAVQSSASIGIVVGGADRGDTGREPLADEADDIAAEAEAVLRDADTAMYEAKRTRKGSWVLFDRTMQERVVRALRTEQDLRRALAHDELSVVYQPVVSLGTGAVAGVEALVRWAHPQRGNVPPSEFIPVAEESGLIEAVGAYVLRAACEDFARWHQALGEQAPPLLAVNLSSAQLRLPGLVADVQRVLAETGVAPASLQLEITESLAAQGEQVQATLRALKRLGVKLALDDFGTGYSSLACLDQLPVDTVKIDRSFVANAQQVEYRRVLIEATIRVARTLGMATVAEGIESPGQARQMAELACDMGQGYLYSRPLVAGDLAEWLRQRAACAGGSAAETETGALAD
jgi:diguanylate cyclase (GGDEF)-like protein/PAS domain S-box-containing protein